MKTFTFFVLFVFAAVVLQAQNYQISFTGSGQSTTIDSIQVENLTQGTSLSLDGDDVLNLVGIVGIYTITANESNVKIYPNPMVESTFIEFANSKTELVCLEIFNELGILIAKQCTPVQQGSQKFKISELNAGIYNVNVSAADWKYTAKLISLGKSAGNTAIEHQGTNEGSSPENAIKITKELVQMQYNDGEWILFKSFSGIYTRVYTLLPTQSQTVNFEFIPCTDDDGNNYAVVTIGTQIWMAENLNFETSNSWWYNNSSANGDIYGRLYTRYAALDACPSGWKLPSDEEWKGLEMALGMSQSEADNPGWRGTDQGAQMKSISGWNNNSNSTNSSGFSALPGGERYSSGGFANVGYGGYWWSSTEDSNAYGWYRYIDGNFGQVYRNNAEEAVGLSVRCLKE